MPSITSQIEGEFEGTEDETTYTLTNGQIWQQIGYKYKYSYLYRPHVEISANGQQGIMSVDGFSDPIKVRRIR